MSQKRKRSPERASKSNEDITIFRSAPIEDRSSTFIALFSPSLKPKELQNLGEISSASHKILASRKESNQQSITGGTKYSLDHDDDGERYAGKRVENVLGAMNVVGACVVARWYGGVMLGPVRFTHIETCTKEAVQQWKDSVAEDNVKKRKKEEDAKEKPKMVKALLERDQSVVVLRTLAAEKEDRVKQKKEGVEVDEGPIYGEARGEEKAEPVATKPAIDYNSMSVEQLKKLDKARDATISFLLKRLDKAEAELAELDPSKPP